MLQLGCLSCTLKIFYTSLSQSYFPRVIILFFFIYFTLDCFWQVINHGASDESLGKMRDQVERFFELPFEEKMRCAQRPGSLEGYGQAFVTSQNQKLDWNDMIFLKTQPIQNRNIDLWPQNPPHFRYA